MSLSRWLLREGLTVEKPLRDDHELEEQPAEPGRLFVGQAPVVPPTWFGFIDEFATGSLTEASQPELRRRFVSRGGGRVKKAHLRSRISGRFLSTKSRSTARSSSPLTPTARPQRLSEPYLASAAASVFRCSLKAWRRRPNCNSCGPNGVMKCRDTCLDVRTRSIIFETSRMPNSSPGRARFLQRIKR
jgi:hypothetical protein